MLAEERVVTANREYWFPAKRRGWGWGPPVVWQGRAVLGVFFALVLAGAAVLLPRAGAAAFIAYTAVLCGLLVVVCWLTGEPPGGSRS